MSQQQLFGLVPAGQPVIYMPTQTPTPTSFLYAVPQAPSGKPFSHIVVFLLPGVVLPQGTAAAIYLVTPPGPGQAEPNSKFLGGIGTGKESAIFKLGGNSSPTTGSENVVIGISVEPAESVSARMAELSNSKSSSAGQDAFALVPASSSLSSSASDQSKGLGQFDTLVLAQRIIRHAFNFLTSFTSQQGGVEVVPLRAFEDWWRKFEAKLKADPKFLDRVE